MKAIKKGLGWHPSSWRSKHLSQVPSYADLSELKSVASDLSNYPPLIHEKEVMILRAELAQIAQGNGFLFQGGDCAESFEEFSNNNINKIFESIMQNSLLIKLKSKKEITKLFRIAGQFAKPRSSDYEIHNGEKIPIYRGDIINSSELKESSRRPEPERMKSAYFQSAATLNHLNNLKNAEKLNISKNAKYFDDFFDRIDSLKNKGNISKIISGANIDDVSFSSVDVNFYTSHESLLLEYEEPFAKKSSLDGCFYDLSGHFLWVGYRTAYQESAHVEFLRGIQNPIGLKCGPNLEKETLLNLCKKLNPKNEYGRLTLIVRLGSDKISEKLPEFIKIIKENNLKVLWCCDPMHGNTFKTEGKIKTRSLKDIISELNIFCTLCKENDVYPGGVHLEMTGKEVTECLGGTPEVKMNDLKKKYESACDPRLNCFQSLDVSMHLANLLSEN